MISPSCRRQALSAFEEKAAGNSALGSAKTRENPEVVKALTTKGSDHHRLAEVRWQKAKEDAKTVATESDCSSCLGRLGIQLCPLLSEVDVSISNLYDELGTNRKRLIQALSGEAKGVSPHDSTIAETVGTLVSNIDEEDYAKYFREEERSTCPFRQDPHPYKTIAEELLRGISRREAEDIGIGSEKSPLGGTLASDMDAEGVLSRS